MKFTYMGQKETCRLYNKNARGWFCKINLFHDMLLKCLKCSF